MCCTTLCRLPCRNVQIRHLYAKCDVILCSFNCFVVGYVFGHSGHWYVLLSCFLTWSLRVKSFLNHFSQKLHCTVGPSWCTRRMWSCNDGAVLKLSWQIVHTCGRMSECVVLWRRKDTAPFSALPQMSQWKSRRSWCTLWMWTCREYLLASFLSHSGHGSCSCPFVWRRMCFLKFFESRMRFPHVGHSYGLKFLKNVRSWIDKNWILLTHFVAYENSRDGAQVVFYCLEPFRI